MARRRPIVSYVGPAGGPGNHDIQAQRREVEVFAQANGYRVVEEFAGDQDKDGHRGGRGRLRAALDRAQRQSCPIVVPGLGWLSRHMAVVEEVAAREVPVIVAGQAPVVVRRYRGWTERERERHGRKIKRSLAAKKAEGVQLGNPTNLATAGAAGRETQGARADAFAAELLAVIEEVRVGGAASFRAIAEELNRRGIESPRGGRWLAMTVRRVVERGRAMAGG